MARCFGLSSIHSYIIPEGILLLHPCPKGQGWRIQCELITSADTPQTSVQSLISCCRPFIQPCTKAPRINQVVKLLILKLLELMEEAMK